MLDAEDTDQPLGTRCGYKVNRGPSWEERMEENRKLAEDGVLIQERDAVKRRRNHEEEIALEREERARGRSMEAVIGSTRAVKKLIEGCTPSIKEYLS